MKKVGSRDGDEIMAVRWVSLAGAVKLLSYTSDLELLAAFHARGAA